MSFTRTYTPPPKLRDCEPGSITPLQGVVYARIGEVVVTVPKGIKAKPGKRAPTAEERAWMDWIVNFGCIACRIDGTGYVAPCVHHILRGGQRMGHLFTLPLCSGHHQDGTGMPGLIARHPYKTRFEARYGGELVLLEMLRLEYQKQALAPVLSMFDAMKGVAK
jgi:hypothetical protein